MHQIGRPALSTLAKNLGAIPRAANAWSVRVLPKVQLLATEMTDRVITPLKIPGKNGMFALAMAKTKGENFVFWLEAPRRRSGKQLVAILG